MKALTIQQPWAWAVAHAAKTTENRTGPTWRYRGPIAIHAGSRLSTRALTDPRVVAALAAHYAYPGELTEFTTVDTVLAWADREHLARATTGERCPLVPGMAVIGTATLADAHRAEPGCCADPWADLEYGGAPVATHYVLTDARPLPEPIVNVPGRLGLWTLSDPIAARLEASRA